MTDPAVPALRRALRERLVDAMMHPPLQELQDRPGRIGGWWQADPHGEQDRLQALHLTAAVAAIALAQLGMIARSVHPPRRVLVSPGGLDDVHEAVRAIDLDGELLIAHIPVGPALPGDLTAIGALCWQPPHTPLTIVPLVLGAGKLLPCGQIMFDEDLRQLPASFHPGAVLFGGEELGRIRSIDPGAEGRCAQLLDAAEDIALEVLGALSAVGAAGRAG